METVREDRLSWRRERDLWRQLEKTDSAGGENAKEFGASETLEEWGRRLSARRRQRVRARRATTRFMILFISIPNYTCSSCSPHRISPE